MRLVRAMGYKVALHTAGIHPRRLAEVLPLIDWVGMDVKTRFHRYGDITGVHGSGERARRSVELIRASAVAHEFRTTVHPALLPADTLHELADELAQLGIRRYVLQVFRPTGCHSAALLEPSEHNYRAEDLHSVFAPHFEHFSLRAI
jgi:pyruvate formate lyase activating enzyme